jgi:CRP-like cAMP-binding protein
MDVNKLLAAVPLFSDLDALELQALAGITGMARAQDRQPLLVEGQPPPGIYVIVTGKVSVLKHRDGAGDHICDLDGGECVGEVEIIDGTPCAASVVALGDVDVLGISKQAFDAFLMARPVTAVKILRRMVSVLSSRLRQINTNYSSLKAIAEGS